MDKEMEELIDLVEEIQFDLDEINIDIEQLEKDKIEAQNALELTKNKIKELEEKK